MVQEYVGTADEEYTVGVLSDLNGNFINSIAVKRLMSGQLNIRSSVTNRSTRQDLGKKLVISSGVSQGHVGKFPIVTSQCEDIARQLGSTGPLNIQCRLVKGEVKVFEINPRFSGTTSLRAMVGFNEPDLLIRKHLFNEEIEPSFRFDSGLIIRSLQENRVNN
jgi:carbamoyl-phosphate synthase large subunit